MDKNNNPIWRQGKSWRLQLHGGKGIIEHPGAVALVPMMEINGRLHILMIEQYRLALDQTILELPAGTRGWNEAWLDCAQRELREETGFRAKKFVSLGDVWLAPGYSNEKMRFYLATDLSEDPLPQDDDEEITLRPFPLSALAAMAQDGRLQDAKSIVGILRAAQKHNA